VGLKELQQDMHRLGDVESRKQLKETNKKAADLVAQGAIFYVPVGETGRLLGSIGARAGETWAEVKAGGASVPYAGPIHWGWPDRNIAPHKFIYKAADESQAEIHEIYAEDFDRLMDQIRSRR